MNQNINVILPFVLVAAVGVMSVFVGSTIYSRYLGLKRRQSALLWLLAIGGAIITLDLPWFDPLSHGYAASQGIRPMMDRYNGEGKFPISLVVSIFSLWILTIPFVVRLYRKWIGGGLTCAERLPGIDGVRAWLGVGNVICASLIPIFLWQLLGGSLWAKAGISFGVLLAYPLLKTAAQSVQNTPPVPTEDLSRERDKVLQLLEAGKINADESAELLNALSHSSPLRAKQVEEINPQRKIILLGAAFLLVGFFLPWITFNPGEAVSQMINQVQQSVSSQMPAMAGNPGITFPTTTTALNTSIRACGGDMAHGLGWWILALGVIAAVLPFFATNLSSAMQKKVMLACLGAGTVLLIYLFTNSLSYVSVGILLALTGYALELIGTLQERTAVRD